MQVGKAYAARRIQALELARVVFVLSRASSRGNGQPSGQKQTAVQVQEALPGRLGFQRG